MLFATKGPRKERKRENNSMDEKSIPYFQFPPGIRFHPSDEELIIFYLQKKVKCLPLPANLMTDIDLYKYNPWELPMKAVFGEDEWYFFTPRDRKYPKGGRPNRTAASGYWKATGTDKPIIGTSGTGRIGVKKGLVFYTGKPPKGIKSDWVMTEYRLTGTTSRPSIRSRASMRLDDWVLCRVRQKGNKSKDALEFQHSPSELPGQLPRIEELHSVEERDMIDDYFLSNGCQLIASLVNGHEIPKMDTIPRATLQSNGDGTVTTAQEANSVFENFFSSLPGHTNGENWYLNLQLLTKMISNEEHRDDNDISGNMVAAGDTNLYIQHMCEGGKINSSRSNVIMNLQHFNVPTLSENYFSDTLMQQQN